MAMTLGEATRFKAMELEVIELKRIVALFTSNDFTANIAKSVESVISEFKAVEVAKRSDEIKLMKRLQREMDIDNES